MTMFSVCHRFYLEKIQRLSRTHFLTTPFSAKKSLESMSFLVLPQHEQFYPECLSVFASFPLGWIKL